MGNNSDIRFNRCLIRYDADLLAPMEPRLFDVDWVKRNDHHRGTSAGRNQAHFLNYAGRDLVLRHFRRGGLLGKLNRDLYLGLKVEKSRSMREFALLGWMRDQDLPVPIPVAACVRSLGLVYRAAIITARIPDARPVQDVLREQPLPPEVWKSVGTVIRHMHDLNVFHSDLNCRNILLDTRSNVWLIDFDKCDRRTPGPWKAQNLERLKRSFHKSIREDAKTAWQEA
ncbi:MAG: 3-deoxy-D-manno-octulosonic acid kinase, partial [Arenibacterium sp.]